MHEKDKSAKKSSEIKQTTFEIVHTIKTSRLDLSDGRDITVMVCRYVAKAQGECKCVGTQSGGEVDVSRKVKVLVRVGVLGGGVSIGVNLISGLLIVGGRRVLIRVSRKAGKERPDKGFFLTVP